MKKRDLFDQDEFIRWLEQAEDTLKSADHDLKDGDYNWACFKAQQAAEYSVKALLYGLGEPAAAVGHSILSLLEELGGLGVGITEELLGFARRLDKHYIPTRYPNAHPAGSPFKYYDQKDASESLKGARAIVQFVKARREELEQAMEEGEEEEDA